MLDIKKIRENKEWFNTSLQKRMGDIDPGLDNILSLDDQRKEITQELELLRSKKNSLSKEKPSADIIEEIKKENVKIKELEEKQKAVQLELKNKLGELPNIVADDVVAGDKENNKVVLTYKEKPIFDFKNKDHVELAESLDIIDYKRAVKMSGSGFWLYKGDGALLEWALLNYFKEFHSNNNYTFLLLPLLLNEESAYASGHMPKFRDDLFWVEDGLCLNATAEMMLGNYHRDEILEEAKLPLKYFSYAPSFRREAGSYRQEERGMIRGHQFNKIEMFQYVKEEDTWDAYQEIRSHAIELLKGLNLHFQVSDLAAADCSAAMAKTSDLEVWIPSMNIYKEVSSISNALDYQCRRSNTRYKKENGEITFPHTLNASGLATSRLIPAILEQNQDQDGNVVIPEILHKYLPENLKVLRKK